MLISSFWKYLAIRLITCGKIPRKRSWKYFNSAFIFTKTKHSDYRGGGCWNITSNGKHHMIFDFLSCLENCLLIFFGGYFVTEETFRCETFTSFLCILKAWVLLRQKSLISTAINLGSVACPEIQANGRLSF